MGVVSRIIEYIDFKELTKYKFYKKTGLSNGCLDKGENLGSDKCERIISFYPDINPTWLLTGSGEMLQNTSNLVPEAPIRQPDVSELSLIYQLLKEKDIKIEALAEEIGRLKAENMGLEEENKELLETLKSIPKHVPVSSVEIA